MTTLSTVLECILQGEREREREFLCFRKGTFSCFRHQPTTTTTAFEAAVASHVKSFLNSWVKRARASRLQASLPLTPSLSLSHSLKGTCVCSHARARDVGCGGRNHQSRVVGFPPRKKVREDNQRRDTSQLPHRATSSSTIEPDSPWQRE